MLANVQEVICAKGAELYDGATCKIIKGCQRKVAGPVKSIIAKLEAEVARIERASNCADKKCPHIGYCSSNTEFNAWGNIKAYPRRCSYMIEPCMRVRGQMQAMQCMQKRYKACRRGCGLRD